MGVVEGPESFSSANSGMARNRPMGARQVLNRDIDNPKFRIARGRWCVSHDPFQGCRRAHSHDDGAPLSRMSRYAYRHTTAAEDTPTAALLRECAAKTVDALLAELRRRPIVQPEWLSLQEAAIYCGYSEQQFSDFVKRSIAPKSILFSRNARRFKRSDVDAWCAAGGPSAYASMGERGGVQK